MNYYISAGGFPAKRHMNYSGEILVRHDAFSHGISEEEVVMAVVCDEKFDNANTGVISDMIYEVFADWYDNGMKQAMDHFSFKLVTDFWREIIGSINRIMHEVQTGGKDPMGSAFAGLFIAGDEYVAMRSGNIEILETGEDCRSIFKRDTSYEYAGRTDELDIEIVRGKCKECLYTILSSEVLNSEKGRKEILRVEADFDADDEVMKDIINNAGKHIKNNGGDTDDNLLVFIKAVSDISSLEKLS